MLGAAVVAALVAGSAVYCVLVLVAARKYLQTLEPAGGASSEPVSILKPLHGIDNNLEANLRTFFEQDHPAFEILFALRSFDDPAIALVERLQNEYPRVPSRLIVTGEPPYANAKVYSLDRMSLADFGGDTITVDSIFEAES